MRHDEYQRWVHRLAQYDPKSGVPGSPRDAIYREMVKKCVPLEDRVAINQDAIRAYNANRPATIKRPVCNWTEMPTYTGHMDDYVNQSRYVKPIDLRPGKMNVA